MVRFARVSCPWLRFGVIAVGGTAQTPEADCMPEQTMWTTPCSFHLPTFGFAVLHHVVVNA